MSRVTNYNKPRVPEPPPDLALDVARVTGAGGHLITDHSALGRSREMSCGINVQTFLDFVGCLDIISKKRARLKGNDYSNPKWNVVINNLRPRLSNAL